MGRRILDIIYIRLRRLRTQKLSTCLHASALSPVVEMHFFYRKGLPCMIREKREREREKYSICVTRNGEHMGLPCIKGGERRGHAAQTETNGRGPRFHTYVFLAHIWFTFASGRTLRTFSV
jgi:hypothetical protein